MEETPDAALFAPHVIPSVSPVIGMLSRLRGKYGAFRRVSADGEMSAVQLERAEIPVQLFLDPNGKINGLRIHPEIITSGSIADHAGAIISLSGRTSILVRSGDATLYSHHPEQRLSVGSAFKLCVLAAVMRAVAARRLRCDQVFTFGGTLAFVAHGNITAMAQ